MNDARTLEHWAIPLCGGGPAHWVLGFVDTTMKEVGIIDSAPELAVDHTRSTPGATFLKPWAATWWNLLFQPKVRQ